MGIYKVILCNPKLGSMKWHREESLTNIINVELVDLPVSDIEAAIEKEFGNKECKCIIFIRIINCNDH